MKHYFTMHKLSFNKETLFYFISFILPGLIFVSYFFYTHNGILTVDLGQQYVDFLAFFRSNLFTHPLKLIYTFSNGLGGSMLATDAYYLFSPFNLLLFLFPQKFVPQAILIIIALKIAMAGLTSYYYWHQKIANYFYVLAASSSYALSGYVIGNYYNLMWLDAVLLLPLLIDAIDKVLAKQKNHLTLITFLLWLTNFYTAFMALLFGLLYFLTKIFFIKKESRLPLFWNYLKCSMFGSFFNAFMLLPVFVEMLQGKAASSAQWSWGFQFPPYEQFSKLADGAYNFHEMQEGMPNIYIALPLLMFTILYFLSKKINWQNKLANGLLLSFLIASLFWTPLVLLWHLGQFPVWYPGRFSFVLIFLSLNLAIDFLRQHEKISLIQIGILAILALGLAIYLCLNQGFEFLTQEAQISSCSFLALGLLFIGLIYQKTELAAPFFYLIVELELIINVVLSLGNLAYQKDSDFQNFAANTNQATQYLKMHDQGFYRTEKTFYRSDGDPFTADYNGLSSFNSISDQRVLNLLMNLGFVNNSNSYNNFGGTPITDDLLGVKYYLLPNNDIIPLRKNKQMKYNNPNHRIDVSDYAMQKKFKQLLIVKNNHALPLLFLSPTAPKEIKFDPASISNNQNLFFKQATGKKTQLFTRVIWPDPKKIGVTGWEGGWMQYSRKKHAQVSRVIFNFRPHTNDSYYLELPGDLDENSAEIHVNDSNLNLSVRDPDPRLINLGSQMQGQRIQIAITLKKNDLNLNSANLWRLNTTKLNTQITAFKRNQPIFSQAGLKIKSNRFATKKAMTMNSTIPASSNWLIFDKGKLLHQNKTLFMKTFLNFKLVKGQHQITLIYIPWIFLIGLLITIISIIIYYFSIKNTHC
ncbi:YfhO family protein [Lactobacillus kefiranofaciens]|nr:YfhO family protein [Lactobacillus kefiranofaciens]